jgi:hypothetical protein
MKTLPDRENQMRTSIAGRLAATALVAASFTAWAATSQDAIDEAKRAKELAEEQKAAAEARKATVEADAATAKAKLGTLDMSKFTKPSGEGKTLNVEGSILAYKAVDRIASAIAKDVAAASSVAGPVVLFGDKEFSAFQQARAFRQGLKQQSEAMSKLKLTPLAADNDDCSEPKEGGAAGLGVLGSLDVAMQVAQLFKVDKKFEGSDVTVDEAALAASVMKELRRAGVATVIYGSLYPAGAFKTSTAAPPAGVGGGGPAATAEKDISALLDVLEDRKVSIDVTLAAIARRTKALKDREENPKVKLPDLCKAAFLEARDRYAAMEIQGKSLKERADKFLTAATTVDEKTGTTLLQPLLQAEALAQQTNVRLLRLKSVTGGATTYTRTTWFSTSVGVGGGAVVSYMLIDGSSGTILASGTAYEYGGFVEPTNLGASLAPQ